MRAIERRCNEGDKSRKRNEEPQKRKRRGNKKRSGQKKSKRQKKGKNSGKKEMVSSNSVTHTAERERIIETARQLNEYYKSLDFNAEPLNPETFARHLQEMKDNIL